MNLEHSQGVRTTIRHGLRSVPVWCGILINCHYRRTTSTMHVTTNPNLSLSAMGVAS